MRLISALADLCLVMFVATFLVNFLFWIRAKRQRPLLHIPEGKIALGLLYCGGLGGPMIFFLGKILTTGALSQSGLIITNASLASMNIAALIVQRASAQSAAKLATPKG